MATAGASSDAMSLALPGPIAVRRTRVPKSLYAAGLFVAFLVAIAIGAPLLAPHNAERGSLRARLKAPTLEAPDGRAHILGTDQLGRDVLSRMVFGTRVSLTIGFAAVALGGAIGGMLGLIAGWGAVKIMVRLFPALPASPPVWAVISAVALSLAVGALFGWLPARRAAGLDPVAALAGR